MNESSVSSLLSSYPTFPLQPSSTSTAGSRAKRLSQQLITPLNVALAEKVPIPTNDKESARWLRQQGFLEPRHNASHLSNISSLPSTLPSLHSSAVVTPSVNQGITSSSSSSASLLRRVRPPAPLSIRIALQPNTSHFSLPSMTTGTASPTRLSSSSTLTSSILPLSKPSSPLSFSQGMMNISSRTLRPSNPFASGKSAPLYRYAVSHHRNPSHVRSATNFNTAACTSFSDHYSSTFLKLSSSSTASNEGYSIFEENRFTVLAHTPKERGTSIYAVFDCNSAITNATNDTSTDSFMDRTDNNNIRNVPSILGKRSVVSLSEGEISSISSSSYSSSFLSHRIIDWTTLHVRFAHRLGHEWDSQHIAQSVTEAWNTALQEILINTDDHTSPSTIRDDCPSVPHSSVIGILSKTKFVIVRVGTFIIRDDDYCRAYLVQPDGSIVRVNEDLYKFSRIDVASMTNGNLLLSLYPSITYTEIPVPNEKISTKTYPFLVLTTISIPPLSSSLLLTHNKLRSAIPWNGQNNYGSTVFSSSHGNNTQLSVSPKVSLSDNPPSINDDSTYKGLMNMDARSIADIVLEYDPVVHDSSSSSSANDSNGPGTSSMSRTKRSKRDSDGSSSSNSNTSLSSSGTNGTVLVVDLRYPANI